MDDPLITDVLEITHFLSIELPTVYKTKYSTVQSLSYILMDYSCVQLYNCSLIIFCKCSLFAWRWASTKKLDMKMEECKNVKFELGMVIVKKLCVVGKKN